MASTAADAVIEVSLISDGEAPAAPARRFPTVKPMILARFADRRKHPRAAMLGAVPAIAPRFP
ncbi:hypothetical protein WL93_03220 [Burkholderia diffusa]|nr:hypothetical protein WL93_03220 [Burkholderia diffusa]